MLPTRIRTGLVDGEIHPCDSCTRAMLTISATKQIGMFTKKIQRQLMPLVRMPPSTGPTATATPVVAPKAPNATPRSRPLNAEAIRARYKGEPKRSISADKWSAAMISLGANPKWSARMEAASYATTRTNKPATAAKGRRRASRTTHA